MSRTPASPLVSCLKSALCGLLAALILLAPVADARAFFGDFTLKDERELGEEFYMMAKAKLPIIEDPEVADYAQHLVNRILKHTPRMPWKFKTSVVRSNALNAFAAPAGYVFIYTGLILNFETEDELAWVLSHELAHVTQRHLAHRVEAQKKLQPLTLLGALAGMFLGVAAGGSSGAAAAQALLLGTQAATTSAMLAYSRTDEREADQVGMNYFVAAGYNPKAAVSAFGIMRKKQLYQGSTIPPYLSTHPGIDERMAYLQDRIRRMPGSVVHRKTDNTQFKRVQALIRARYTDPQVALGYYKKHADNLTCYDKMGQGIIANKLHKVQEARKYFAEALKCGDNDSLVLREAGRFFFSHGDFSNAAKYLQKAIILHPSDLMALFFLARLMGEKKEYAQAIEYMERIKDKLPEDGEIRYWLGRYQGLSGNLFDAQLELAYAGLYDNKPEKAKYHIKQSQQHAKTPEQEQQIEEFDSLLKKREAFW